jgi:acetyl esterase
MIQRASPLLAPDLSGLPPALIITAEYDPLRNKGEAFGKRLQEDGILAKISRYAGMIHDFPNLFEEPGNRAVDEIAAALRDAFNEEIMPAG